LRILDHDELPSGSEEQMHLLDMSAGWGAFSFAQISKARRMGYFSADYFGVYAVEGEEILSAVRVIKLPFTTSSGVERIAGIQGVVTRRDHGRSGLARQLLEEVHRREKKAGTRFSLLWTGRGMIAHGLYEKLGYVDVYTPELAVKRVPSKPDAAKGYGLRRARKADFALIEKLHTKATTGKLGFTRRPAKDIEFTVQFGFSSLDSLRIIVKAGQPVGYAQVQKLAGWPRLEELVLSPTCEPANVLHLFEAEAARGWFALRNSSVREHRGLLEERGYAISNLAYYSLLAKPLDGGSHDLIRELGTTSPQFPCQAFDYF
jgi:GNAT superfamily N-acetyltransferase